MTFATSITEWLAAWPLAFCLGLGIGLALSSRYRITRITDNTPSDDDTR